MLRIINVREPAFLSYDLPNLSFHQQDESFLFVLINIIDSLYTISERININYNFMIKTTINIEMS